MRQSTKARFPGKYLSWFEAINWTWTTLCIAFGRKQNMSCVDSEACVLRLSAYHRKPIHIELNRTEVSYLKLPKSNNS